jgi:hypothetical protein
MSVEKLKKNEQREENKELSMEELDTVAGGANSIPMSALGEDKGPETDSTRLKSSPMRLR